MGGDGFGEFRKRCSPCAPGVGVSQPEPPSAAAPSPRSWPHWRCWRCTQQTKNIREFLHGSCKLLTLHLYTTHYAEDAGQRSPIKKNKRPQNKPIVLKSAGGINKAGSVLECIRSPDPDSDAFHFKSSNITRGTHRSGPVSPKTPPSNIFPPKLLLYPPSLKSKPQLCLKFDWMKKFLL